LLDGRRGNRGDDQSVDILPAQAVRAQEWISTLIRGGTRIPHRHDAAARPGSLPDRRFTPDTACGGRHPRRVGAPRARWTRIFVAQSPTLSIFVAPSRMEREQQTRSGRGAGADPATGWCAGRRAFARRSDDPRARSDCVVTAYPARPRLHRSPGSQRLPQSISL
jgi:hypothetical protein